jgi:hypothetical protein
LQRNYAPIPNIQHLTLSGAPGLQLVAQTLKASKRVSNAMYVSQTHLQYASVTVGTVLTSWVTDARGSPPPAVVGAEVAFYLSSYGWGAEKVTSCKTGADGSCSVDLKAVLKGR